MSNPMTSAPLTAEDHLGHCFNDCAECDVYLNSPAGWRDANDDHGRPLDVADVIVDVARRDLRQLNDFANTLTVDEARDAAATMASWIAGEAARVDEGHRQAALAVGAWEAAEIAPPTEGEIA